MRPGIAKWGLAAVFCQIAAAQAEPDVAEILRDVARVYTAASQYELMADLKVPGRRPTSRAGGHMRFAFQAPNRYRIEGTIPGLSDSPFGEATLVADGSVLWFYLPRSNEYGTLSLTGDGDLAELRPEAMDRFMMSRYRGAAEFAGRAKFLREEEIEFGGARLACDVLAVSQKSGGPAYTWWIDRARRLILREDFASSDSASSTVFTMIKLGERLPDDLFKFEPPPGARKIEN